MYNYKIIHKITFGALGQHIRWSLSPTACAIDLSSAWTAWTSQNQWSWWTISSSKGDSRASDLGGWIFKSASNSPLTKSRIARFGSDFSRSRSLVFFTSRNRSWGRSVTAFYKLSIMLDLAAGASRCSLKALLSSYGEIWPIDLKLLALFFKATSRFNLVDLALNTIP